MILEFARRGTDQVGSNVQGAFAPPLWAYLLPSLELISPCSVGDVSSELRRSVGSWENSQPLLPGEDVPPRCRLLLVGPGAQLPSEMRARLQATNPGLAIFAEASAAEEIAPGLGFPRTWWFLPDEMPRSWMRRTQGVDFKRENGALSYAIRIPKAGQSRRSYQRALRIAARAFRRLHILNGRTRGPSMPAAALAPGGAPRSSLASEGALYLSATPALPPEWLLEIARLSHVELVGREWSILPSRGFRSQKVSFFFGPKVGTKEPEPLAIKMTQAAEFNGRLLNEHRALSLLSVREDFPHRMIPRPLFSANHRGLALIAQTKLPGDSFIERSSGGANCPVAARALEAIHTLTVSSARAASGSDHGEAIGELLRRFREAYRPENELWQAAESALEQLTAIARVPSVFLHGDPEPQNLIVEEDGEIALIDWENAEVEGPPLWDHFSFLISYARFSLERSGIRPTSASVARRLFSPSPWADWVVRSTADLTARLQMSEAAIEPLLILHAAVMSVRELWRLPAGRLGKGTWIRWMGELVRCRDRTPVLAAWRRSSSDGARLR